MNRLTILEHAINDLRMVTLDLEADAQEVRGVGLTRLVWPLTTSWSRFKFHITNRWYGEGTRNAHKTICDTMRDSRFYRSAWKRQIVGTVYETVSGMKKQEAEAIADRLMFRLFGFNERGYPDEPPPRKDDGLKKPKSFVKG